MRLRSHRCLHVLGAAILSLGAMTALATSPAHAATGIDTSGGVDTMCGTVTQFLAPSSTSGYLVINGEGFVLMPYLPLATGVAVGHSYCLTLSFNTAGAVSQVTVVANNPNSVSVSDACGTVTAFQAPGPGSLTGFIAIGGTGYILSPYVSMDSGIAVGQLYCLTFSYTTAGLVSEVAVTSYGSNAGASTGSTQFYYYNPSAPVLYTMG